MEKINRFRGKYFFLSNFYPFAQEETAEKVSIVILYDCLAFACSECAYQAAKTNYTAIRRKISRMTPQEAVAFWKEEKNRKFMRDDWQEVKLEVMEDILMKKFGGDPYLMKRLKATGNAVLEEGNDRGDTFWGVCEGVGENHLGKLLMKIRDNA